ncbi:MAG: helix-turn-helix domain-containing protein [Cytophagales bacterium]|nr:helix-turn-helix domain-containing protein [Cytophagales bacterium]
MAEIKTYREVNRGEEGSFRISRMEDIYEKIKQSGGEKPHRHNYYTVILTEKAKGKHIIDFHEYELESSQVFFVSPGQVHHVVEEQKSMGFSFVFSSQFLLENNIDRSFIANLNLFHDYGKTPPLVLTKEQLTQLNKLCEEMVIYSNSSIRFKEQALGSLLKLFLIQCTDFLPISDNLQETESGNTILKNFKKLVDEHYKEWHSTSQYAEELNITPDYLNRTVKSLIGKTAKEYIQSRITTAAKRMLYFTDASAKEIAYELGFSEPANFSNFFKKCTKMSPSQFKKSH